MLKFLKKGSDAQAELKKAEAQTEARKAASGAAQRFWIPEGGSGSITFLDGDLNEQGMLDVPVFREHQLEMNGHWRNWFACTHENEPCPICEDGNQPSLVAVMSVIDHSEYKDREGKLHKDQKRLYVCKRDTLRLLTTKAVKKGGLTGWRVDVGRIGDKSANVGNDFDFVEKTDVTEKPFNYDEVITYLTGDQLRELGFGKKSAKTYTPAYQKKSAGNAGASSKNLDDEL